MGKSETLGDWCKWLEKNFSPEVMIPTLPVIIRIDGNNFHSYTKGLSKPFDAGLVCLMAETTKFLVRETNAVIGYTQSDEITLVLYSSNRKSSIYHDGKKQKILSKLTAKCVNFFNGHRNGFLSNHDKTAVFDCRIYQVPTLDDACSQLLWRENDATKNSISMLARSLFPHSALENLNSDELQEKMMSEKGTNWSRLPTRLKRGTYVRNEVKTGLFSAEELALLPPRHHAHTNPNLSIERRRISEVDFPPMSKIKNRVGVVFHGEVPILRETNEKADHPNNGPCDH